MPLSLAGVTSAVVLCSCMLLAALWRATREYTLSKQTWLLALGALPRRRTPYSRTDVLVQYAWTQEMEAMDRGNQNTLRFSGRAFTEIFEALLAGDDGAAVHIDPLEQPQLQAFGKECCLCFRECVYMCV